MQFFLRGRFFLQEKQNCKVPENKNAQQAFSDTATSEFQTFSLNDPEKIALRVLI